MLPNAMKKIALEDKVVQRIYESPFGHFLVIGKLVVNNFQLNDFCGRYVGHYTFELKKKRLRVIVGMLEKF